MDPDTEHSILKFLSELITNTLMPNTVVETSGKPLNPTSTTLKSLKHRIQVHLEIIASVRRMIFGVSMKHSKTTVTVVNTNDDCFQVCIGIFFPNTKSFCFRWGAFNNYVDQF